MNSHSAPELLEQIVAQAERAGASDVHLHMSSDGAEVAFRLDGVLTPVRKIDRELAERLFGRIKFLAHLKTYQESLPQDGRIERVDAKSKSDLRVSTYPTVTGEKIVLRLFSENRIQKLSDLKLPEAVENELGQFLRQTSGMLLLTGPAGSGKTTTIYSCLHFLAELGGRHIITVEDPVEQIIPGVMQTEINEARGLTFATAARHLLRQDPQVLVIGEIRDDETAGIAIRAALTGHLVISTLHAGSCKGVFERLFNMSPDRYAIISAVGLVLNQRLVRRICEKCKGEGCEACLQTGCRGRLPVVEMMRLTDTHKRNLREAGAEAIAPETTLEQAAQKLFEAGEVSKAEFNRWFGV